MLPVPAGHCDAPLRSGKPDTGPFAPAGATPLPRHPMGIPLLAGFKPPGVRRMEDLPVAGRDLPHVHVDADRLAVVVPPGHCDLVTDHRIPLPADPFDRHRLGNAVGVWIPAPAAKCHPAEAGKVQSSVPNAHIVGYGHGVIASPLEARTTALALEELLPGIGLVLERVPDRRKGHVLEPWLSRLRRRPHRRDLRQRHPQARRPLDHDRLDHGAVDTRLLGLRLPGQAHQRNHLARSTTVCSSSARRPAWAAREPVTAPSGPAFVRRRRSPND